MNKKRTLAIGILSVVFVAVCAFGIYTANQNKVEVIVKEFKYDLLNKDDYKIITKDITTDFKLNIDESEFLVNKLYSEDLKSNSKIENIKINVLSNEKETNEDLENLTQQISVEKKDKLLAVTLRNINIVDGGVQSVPTEYKIENIKESNGLTTAEVIIPSNLDTKQGLSQLKIIAQSIKELNKDKDIKDIYIKGYFDDDRTLRYDYYSKYENIVLYCEEAK